MFIYEKNGAICITFKGNKPVDAPEYVITIDSEKEAVYVNGKQFIDPVEEVIEEVKPVVEDVTKQTRRRTTKVEEPAVEETVSEEVESTTISE